MAERNISQSNMEQFCTKKACFIISLTCLLFFNILSAQNTRSVPYDLEAIEKHFNAQLEAYPHEKLHLHTDRNIYIPGEKIWFKAYLVDAHSHLYPTFSRYVYVELISPADTLVSRVMISQI